MHEATASDSHGTTSTDSHGATGGGQTSAMEGNRGVATLLGYLYHYWNGTTFGLAFLVLFGARRWWRPIPYMVLIIYAGMAVVMGVHSVGDFILETIGHAAFGVTLGVLSWAYLGQWGAGALFPLSTHSAPSVLHEHPDR